MATSFPQKYRAWQFTSIKKGIENSLSLNTINPPPSKPEHHQVQIIAAALNPVDYKPAEIALARRLLIANPAIPGHDFAGRIIVPAEGSSLKQGDLVFGVTALSPLGGGALAEYATVDTRCIVPVPQGVNPVDAATIGIAGLTAYQSIIPKVKKGDKIFINGGSGGCGVLGVQIAKNAGCYVATSCSSRNVDLCKSLGADDVVDYTKQHPAEALKGQDFDHVVDNVGNDISLYYRAHEYTRPGAVYLQIAADISMKGISDSMKANFLPAVLGGGKRKRETMLAQLRLEELTQIAQWIKDGKVKTVIDEKFDFKDAPKAFARSKTGRARGKIVVDISGGA